MAGDVARGYVGTGARQLTPPARSSCSTSASQSGGRFANYADFRNRSNTESARQFRPMRHLPLTVALTVGLVSSLSSAQVPDPNDGIVVEHRFDDRFDGTYVQDGKVVLWFSALQQSPSLYEVTVYLGPAERGFREWGGTLQVDAYSTSEYGAGVVVEWHVKDNILDRGDPAIISGFFQQLSTMVPYPGSALDPITSPHLAQRPHELLLLGLAAIFAEAPYRIPNNGKYDGRYQDKPPAQSGGGGSPPPQPACQVNDDDGIDILEACEAATSATVNASFDTTVACFATTSDVCGTQGVFPCAGRCGPQCWGSANRFTQDCFDHDICRNRVNNGFMGDVNPGDADCGDEWAEAADDTVVTYLVYALISVGSFCSANPDLCFPKP